MEVKRLCDVLDKELEGKRYICGDQYTIADMICLPWFQLFRSDGYVHKSGVKGGDFLSVSSYANLNRWADELVARPAVARGMIVGRKHGKPWLEDEKYFHLAPPSNPRL